jgi:hypothetical protein
VSPANGVIDQDTSLTLVWNAEPLDVTYRLQVATTSNFSSGIIVDDSTLADTTYQLNGLSFQTTYYWRVRGKNWGGIGAWSNPVQNFATAGPPIVQVTIQTNPTDRSFKVDGTTYTSDTTFAWISGSSHTIAVDPIQGDTTNMALMPIISIASLGTPMTDGQKRSPVPFANDQIFGKILGQKQADANAKGKGNAADAESEILGAKKQRDRLADVTIATSKDESDVQTKKNNRSVQVDDASDADGKSKYRVLIDRKIPNDPPLAPDADSAGTRYVWMNWSDGGTISHIVAPATDTTFTANFEVQHYLTMESNVAAVLDPGSGWYKNDTTLSIKATPTDTTSVFSSWTGTGNGSFSGTANPAIITMTGPITETANFDVGLTASIKVFLEGPFSGTTMSKTLNTGGFLASEFPGTPIPSQAVDVINIEIRDAASAASSTIREFAAAWLLGDGSIRNFSDTTMSYVEFNPAPAGLYYIVVVHRNHLAVMSSSSQFLDASTSPAVYNFTTSLSQAFGADPMKAVGSFFAMFGGDGNGDGGVDAIDKNTVWRPANGTSGYLGGDFNLDGGVDATDKNSIWRLKNGTGTQVP